MKMLRFFLGATRMERSRNESITGRAHVRCLEVNQSETVRNSEDAEGGTGPEEDLRL